MSEDDELPEVKMLRDCERMVDPRDARIATLIRQRDAAVRLLRKMGLFGWNDDELRIARALLAEVEAAKPEGTR